MRLFHVLLELSKTQLVRDDWVSRCPEVQKLIMQHKTEADGPQF
ncbi:hypothetical protein DSBG_3204 [Desulfosporosinus sp. BG]|nr:hypothetical protein DSBG_3204 [Desulfosporosinus sp. BG]